MFSSAHDGLLKLATIVLPLVAGKIPGFLDTKQADSAMLMSLIISSFGLLYFYGKCYDERAKNKSKFLMIECLLASVSLLISIVLCVSVISSLKTKVITAAALLYIASIIPVVIEIFITFQIKDIIKQQSDAKKTEPEKVIERS